MGKFIYIDVFRNKNFKCTLKWKEEVRYVWPRQSSFSIRHLPGLPVDPL